MSKVNVASVVPKMTEATRAVKRPARVPIHKQNVFTAENRAGFKRMWINELAGQVESYELAGWVLVADKTKTHDGQSQIESQFDSVVRRVVNRDPNAPCKTAVLMEIPLEIYHEDHCAAQALIDEQERSFDKTGSKDMYGDINVSHRNEM